MLQRAWASRAAPWVASSLAILGVTLVGLFVDVSPQVEGEFFFAEDDPQMQASEAVAERFPSSPQIILRVEDLAADEAAYRARVVSLTDDLLALEGITGGFSIANSDPTRSPLFSRLLLNPDSSATNIILQADRADPEILLPRIERVVTEHRSPELDVVVSGVPVIVELIRRSLYRDLVVFSLSAVLVFALIIGLVYRDPAIVVGTLATCFTSVSLTLIVVQATGMYIGLLTANLVTIVFVLTLSHVVFFTANWRRRAASVTDRSDALSLGIRDTLEGSFWSMTTTLLGFLSLLLATAKPLRDLGVAGAIGTVTAFLVAYTVYPAFLGWWAKPRPAPEVPARIASGGGRRAPVVAAAAAVVALVGLGVLRVDTDPGLLTYFREGTELRDGLERIDRDGGSSTLDIVVRDAEGGRVDSPEVYRELEAFQAALDADSAVGVVVSPTVLVEHARTLPLARMLPVAMLLNIASSPQLDEVALGFVTPEREEAHYFLRMRESRHDEPREMVMERLRGHARGAGLEPVIVAGLYDLQAQLGRLIASSLRTGIGGLLLLFLGVAVVVSRSPLTALKMWACLVAIPAVVLGTFGHLGIAIDIITSPAANVALGMGADSMIHLVVRVRRLASDGDAAPWVRAVTQIGRPVLGATGIIAAGFGIFVLSTFPPTQRFGLAVILGAAAAATAALVVLPRLAGTAFAPSTE